jgi:hypothetical protein
MQNFSDLLFSTENTSTNQPIDFLDASLTDFLPTPLKWVAGNLLLVHHLMIVMTAIY